ncbi:MAG TPA: hypothetical protein VLL94_03310, partial [Nitrospiraceae bacterium]|nr:hypothetical protein [Nitrospiraceae bacterium]
GISILESKFIGSKHEILQLKFLHVSRDCRGSLPKQSLTPFRRLLRRGAGFDTVEKNTRPLNQQRHSSQ